MKKIFVRPGYHALVDNEDYDLVKKIQWHFHRGYVRGSLYPQDGHVLLARLIMNAPHGSLVDHIDHNTLNNQRSNLRFVTRAQNAMNIKKQGYKGIHSRGDRWIAHIHYNYKTHYIGIYNTPEEAAKAYDGRAKRIFGEYAQLNFPTPN